MPGHRSIGRARPQKPDHGGICEVARTATMIGGSFPMTPKSCGPARVAHRETPTIIEGKSVAEDRRLTHPLFVPEAHAGLMVTSSVKLVRPLGEGGMGSVWVAYHEALRTEVVVKFIASDLKNSREATERFSREAAAASQVKSPHVVQTFDHGISNDGVPYIVMELLEGRDLGAHLDVHGRCSPELVLEIVVQLSRALDKAHARGIVHRDIKPGNIFLCESSGDGVFIKLLDFGIAKGVDVPKIDSATKTGAMIGSPFYMSPEQILGSKEIDHRSDLWSVGVVTYEALTGKKPFDAETMGGLAIRIHSEPLPLPTKLVPELSPAVDAWFMRACARKPEERFSSAKEMAEALAKALGGEMPKSIEVPRISTGSSDVSPGAPTLAAGATTEAGLVRPASPTQTRNRLLALMGTALVLGFASFAAVTMMKKGEAKNNAHALVADPAPPSAATSTKVVENTTPPPPVTTVAPLTPSPPDSVAQKPVPPTTPKAGGHGTKPAGNSPKAQPSATVASSASPSTSSAPVKPAPTATGHDIF
jgi:eukaryotic-like serine/threonine-protein kinase